MTNNPWLSNPTVDPVAYDATYQKRAAAGEEVHGEADFVMSLPLPHPCCILDAGCGTGRIAIELARRGVEVVGADLDPRMVAHARRKAPYIEWHQEDLAQIRLGRPFDLILLAGNVLLFLTPGTEAQVIANLSAHLAPGGFLVAGFQLHMAWNPWDCERYDRLAFSAGLSLVERWSTWAGDPFTPQSLYALSVHQRL